MKTLFTPRFDAAAYTTIFRPRNVPRAAPSFVPFSGIPLGFLTNAVRTLADKAVSLPWANTRHVNAP